MKILWIENGEILGGAELFSLDILSEWQKNDEDFEVHVLHSGENPKFAEKLKEISSINPKFSIQDSKFPIPRLKPVSFRTFFLFWKSFGELQKLVKTEKPDVIFSNTVRGFLLQFLVSHPRKIFFAHDFTFPKICLRFARFFFFKAFSCSHSVKKFLVENGFPTEKVVVIENGISPEKFSKFSFPEKIQKIGILGRLVPWKGQKTVLKAAKILLSQHSEIEFFFFGEAEEKHKKFETELLEMRETIPQKNRIFFEGFVPVEKALEKIDLMIHASTEAEPFGRTPVEGAMAKKFLIISDTGTPAEIFSEGTVTFFSAGDEENLAEKIAFLIDHPETAQKKAQNAFAFVHENFLLKNIATKMAQEIVL